MGKRGLFTHAIRDEHEEHDGQARGEVAQVCGAGVGWRGRGGACLGWRGRGLSGRGLSGRGLSGRG